MAVSDLIVKEIISVYAVDKSVAIYINENRPYSAICLKMSGTTVYNQNGHEFLSDDRHVIFIPKGAAYSFEVKEMGSCFIIEFVAENTPDSIQSLVVNESSVIKTIVSGMGYAWRRKQAGYRETCMSSIYQLL